MTRAELIALVTSNIYANNNNEVTAPMVRDSILAVIAFMGDAATYNVGAVEQGGTTLVTGGSVYSAINTALSAAVKFQGVTTTALYDGATTNPITIDGASYTARKGDEVINGGKEFLWTGTKWQQLGDEESWALKTVTISAGTGLTGGGDLTANRTISLSQDSIDKLALAASAYQLPATGIPKTDLAAAVQTTLSNADTVAGYFTSGILGSTHLPSMYVGRTQVAFSAANATLLGIDAISNAASSGNTDKSRIVWDNTNKAWHFLGSIYADGFVSGGGLSSGGGTGGIDLDAMWTSLTTTSDAHGTDKIHTGHLPTLSVGTGLTASYTQTSATATTLNLGINASQIASAIGLGNYVDLTSAQTISATKTFTSGIIVSGRAYSGGDDEGIVIAGSGTCAGLTLGSHNGRRSVFYLRTNTTDAPYWRYNDGTTSYDISHPGKAGTIALTSDIPTTLPASDVYAWAKAATKPSYTFAEITNKIVNTNEFNFAQDGFTGHLWINYRGSTGNTAASITEYRFGSGASSTTYAAVRALKFIVPDGTSSQFLKGDGSLDSTEYLPLSGGTLSYASTSVLQIQNSNSSGAGEYLGIWRGSNKVAEVGWWNTLGAYLQNKNGTSDHTLNLTDAGVLQIDNNTVYHSGNSNKDDVEWTASRLNLGAASTTATSNRYLYMWRGTGTAAMRGLLALDDTSFEISIWNATAQTGYNRLYITSSAVIIPSGYLGVGTTTPSATLEVNGTTKFTGEVTFKENTATYFRTRASWLAGIYYGTGGDEAMCFLTQNTRTHIRFYCGQDISSWTSSSWSSTTPILELNVNGASVTGNLTATGAVTGGQASDLRLKTNIASMTDNQAMSMIMALRPVIFTWNQKARELYDQYKGDDLGFIAQEVEGIPGLSKAIGTIFEDYKRLDPVKFIAPMVKVAQNHETRIQQLERELAQVKSENKILRDRLNMS